MNKELYRSANNKVIAGVCGGVAEYFEIDPTIVRIVWLLLAFPGGVGFLAYLVCWLVMPERNTFASGTNENYASGHRSGEESEKNKRIIGLALIIIGSVFLFDRFFGWFDMAIIVPLVIIAIGIFVLFNVRR